MAFYVWNWSERSEGLAILDNPRLSGVEKLERTQNYSDISVLRRRADVFAEEVVSLSKKLESAISKPFVEEVSRRAGQLAKLKPGAMQTRVDSLIIDCTQKQADILYGKVKDAFVGHIADFSHLSSQFLEGFSTDPRCDSVRDMIHRFRDREENDARTALKVIQVTGASDLAVKGQKIAEFANKYQSTLNSEEAGRMRRAAELARLFSEVQTYTVRLKRTGGLTASYYQAVVLHVDGKVEHEYRSPGKSQEVNWITDDIRIQWTAGQPIRVTWRKLWSTGSWGDSDIATLSDDGPVALRILGGRKALTQIESGWEKYCDNPFVHFDVDDIKEDDWKSVELYLFPGAGW